MKVTCPSHTTTKGMPIIKSRQSSLESVVFTAVQSASPRLCDGSSSLDISYMNVRLLN